MEHAVRSGGSGVFVRTPTGQTVSYSNATGRKCSYFKAETSALQNAVVSIAEMKPQKTVILTDSKAALQSLTSNTPDQSIHQLLKDHQLLPHECTVVLQCIPAHCGISGNERADRLAKSGSKQLQPLSIERAMADSDSKYKIITGDFNAKIETKTKEEDFKSMGAFEIRERNERGDRLIEFAEEHNLIIANTLFQKPKNRYWTWELPDGETRNQIDFTWSSQRGLVTNCKVITKADIGSDHRLVRMTLRINKKLARLCVCVCVCHTYRVSSVRVRSLVFWSSLSQNLIYPLADRLID